MADQFFKKNNIIQVGYPTRLNQVGLWATKYIE